MPTFQVRDNPYFRPARGRNIISDRLLAALESFSAPKEGAYGPKAGFFGALAGNDVNRMNQAEMMRQVDIDAGRVPFEAESAQEDKAINARIGGALTEADLQARAAGIRNDQRIAAQQQIIADRIKAQQEALQQQLAQREQLAQQESADKFKLAEQGQAHNLMRDQLNNKSRIELRRTPRAMSDFESFVSQNPRAVGGFLQFPGSGLTVKPASGLNPAQTFTTSGAPFNPTNVVLQPEEMRFLQFGEEDDQDGDLLKEVE